MPTSPVRLEPLKLKTPGELGQNPWMMLSKGVSLKHGQQGKENESASKTINPFSRQHGNAPQRVI